MAFSSIEFGLFFAAVLVAYALVPQKFRWAVLLAASFLFYSWLGKIYLPLALAVMIAITYLFGRRISDIKEIRERRKLLWAGIASILAIFIGFRYFNFFAKIIAGSAETTDAIRQPIVLTVGISFIAFQAISYMIDVFRGVTEHERHIGYFSLYLAYFPKLLQGPLETAGKLIPQLRSTRINSYENIRSGVVLFSWGLCKKVIIADRMAAIVNQVFGSVRYYDGLSLIVAVYAFAVQIYADFSGYTDMAIGLSRIFGVSLTDNFNQPYFSTSFADFWRRWHISLMNWLRAYVFTPLQIIWRDQRILGSAAAILIVFAISGLWHGVGLTFVIWGILNGLLVAGTFLYHEFVAPPKKAEGGGGVKKFIKIVVVFHLTCLLWVFFRANSVPDAIYVVTHIWRGVHGQLASIGGFERAVRIGQTRSDALLTGVLLLLYGGLEFLLYKRKMKFDELVTKNYFKIRWPIYLGIITAVILFSYRSSAQFVYFNF
jgi:alginate O-acetyltransferase complex protein AlgI